MVKEMVKHTSFRYKLSLVVLLSVAVFIFAIRYIYTTSRTPSLAAFLEADLLDTYANDPLDIFYVEDNLESLDQRDQQLIQYTRVRHLTPPSKQPYNLAGQGNFREAFSGWVADFFKNKRDGVFVEVGAHKGEKGSHTLYLEKELRWTGLLVECNPRVTPYLKSKHRKAWIADVCLSPTTSPATLNVSNPGTIQKPGNLPVSIDQTFFEVDAIPLYTLLAALGWKQVDFLDIQGQELSVLKNFPFELITFKVLVIEVGFFTQKKIEELDELLKSKGFQFVKNLQVSKIYVHKNYKEMIPLK